VEPPPPQQEQRQQQQQPDADGRLADGDGGDGIAADDDVFHDAHESNVDDAR